MTQHGNTDNPGLELDRYGDGDEATLRREPTADKELERYDEDDVATAQWIRRL
jgi:hypothetical protein